MKTTTDSFSERRQEIVTEISRVPVVISGTLTTRKRERGGKAAVYHQLQRWRNGSNDTRHVPADRLEAVRGGVEGYGKIRTLVEEMAALDENAVLMPAGSDSKKNSTKR
jgi:hypothetical protein